jgi:hypothetical protein
MIDTTLATDARTSFAKSIDIASVHPERWLSSVSERLGVEVPDYAVRRNQMLPPGFSKHLGMCSKNQSFWVCSM